MDALLTGLGIGLGLAIGLGCVALTALILWFWQADESDPSVFCAKSSSPDLVDHACDRQGVMQIEAGKPCNWCGKVEDAER